MGNISMITWIALEVAVGLLLVCGFLFAHSRRLKKLIAALEEKIAELRGTVKKSRKETKSVKAELAKRPPPDAIKSWADMLAEAIDTTREHHADLSPDRDIVLDITNDAPIERQAASLRHAFLIAEQEAWHAGDERETDWDVLQGKLSQIIQFFGESDEGDGAAADAPDEHEQSDAARSAGDGAGEQEIASLQEEIANYKKRVDNLERFKKLCFDMEEKWQEASARAAQYEKELLAAGREMGAGEDFEAILAKYGDVYSELGLAISESTGGAAPERGRSVEHTVMEVDSGKGVGSIVVANQEEIQRLRNMAVDQHKVIVDLKKKLVNADSAEEKETVIEELKEQLDRQERFLKESDQCTQLLENELSSALRENQDLESKLKKLQNEVSELQQAGAGAGGGDEAARAEVREMENLVADLTTESRDMLNTISRLEEENAKLKKQAQGGGGQGGGDEKEVKELKSRLSEVQQELLNLQTQHIELEERYLELKMQ